MPLGIEIVINLVGRIDVRPNRFVLFWDSNLRQKQGPRRPGYTAFVVFLFWLVLARFQTAECQLMSTSVGMAPMGTADDDHGVIGCRS